VQEHPGTTAIEKPIKAEVKHPSDLLDKVTWSMRGISRVRRFEPDPRQMRSSPWMARSLAGPVAVRAWRAAIFSSDAKEPLGSGLAYLARVRPAVDHIFRASSPPRE